MLVAPRQFRDGAGFQGTPTSRPLSEQVADLIVSSIAGGRLQPGQRLVEAELADSFQTSRVPIREAVRILEAQGILVATPYRGTRVALFTEAEQTQVTTVRIALERMIVPRAARALRAEPDAGAELDRILGWMKDCAVTGDRDGLNLADVEFHRALSRLAGDAILATLWNTLAHHVIVAFGLSKSRYPNAAAVVMQHQSLAAALTQQPLARLPKFIERHIQGRDVAISTQAARGSPP